MFMAHFHTACLHTSTIPKKSRTSIRFYLVGKHIQYSSMIVGHERRRGGSGRGGKAAAAQRARPAKRFSTRL